MDAETQAFLERLFTTLEGTLHREIGELRGEFRKDVATKFEDLAGKFENLAAKMASNR
jgi:hypothetical protein